MEPPGDLARASNPTLEAGVVHEPFADAVRDVLATAETGVADAVREFIASLPTERAVVAAPVESTTSQPRELRTPDPAGADQIREGVASRPELPTEPAVNDATRDEVASQPEAIITESAERIYVNECHDTVEAPPLERPSTPVAAPITSSLDDLPTPTDAAIAAHVAAIDDRVAAERGVAPIRVPNTSTAFIPLRGASTRTLLVASLSLAAVSLTVAIAAVVWARGAVAEAADKPVARTEAFVRGETPRDAVTRLPPGTIDRAALSCVVSVRSNVEGAIAWIDGAARGPTPTTITRPCNSPAKLEVRHPRYADFKRDLLVEQDVEVDARLEREKTELTIWSQPPGALVMYEGEVVGRTPLTAKVNRFEQGHLYFRADGYESDWRRIVPKESSKIVSITLKKLAPVSRGTAARQ